MNGVMETILSYYNLSSVFAGESGRNPFGKELVLPKSQIGWIFKSKANDSYCLYDSGPMVRQWSDTMEAIVKGIVSDHWS